MITIFLISLAVLAGLYMSWSIGANDVANAMGTSVGSHALTLRQAVLVAAVMEFVGAFFFGARVTETVQSGIIDIQLFANKPMWLVYGMISSLLAAGIWLQLASYWGWPVSTTHTIVGSLVGFGLLSQGVEGIFWNHVFFILGGWVLSPLLGGAISFCFFLFLRRAIFYVDDPEAAAKFWAPFIVFFVAFVLVFIVTVKGFSHLAVPFTLGESLLWGCFVGVVGFSITLYRVRHLSMEKSFRPPSRKGYELRRRLGKARKNVLRALAVSQEKEHHDSLTALAQHIDALEQTLPMPKEEASPHTAMEPVERVFRSLQVMSASLMAFSHGANDVANAIGPLSAALTILTTGTIGAAFSLSPWILALGASGIVVGLATWGWRVMETIGRKITELTPTRGFTAEFGAATTIVLASGLGLPISTTQTLVGSVIGVGLARGMEAINMQMTREIFASWFVTVPVGALITMIFFTLFRTVL